MEKEIVLAKTTKDKIIEYITYFFIYSFLGWIIETIYGTTGTITVAFCAFTKE